MVKTSSYIGVKHIVHLPFQERVGERIQRFVLAVPRAESIREAEKVLFIDLVEDGNHGVLNDLIFQRRDSEWTFPSIFFLYVYSSRWCRSVRSPA